RRDFVIKARLSALLPLPEIAISCGLDWNQASAGSQPDPQTESRSSSRNNRHRFHQASKEERMKAHSPPCSSSVLGPKTAATNNVCRQSPTTLRISYQGSQMML